MRRRGWAIAILAAWVLSLGWLIKRTYFRSTGQRLAEAALAVPPGAVFYRLTVGAQQIGFASTTIDTLQDTIAAESTLVVPDSADYDSTSMAWVAVHFDTVRAFRLEQRSEGLAGSMWVDAQGHIVRASSPTGVTLERTAFELAYENFRRRDTARVARSSAGPGPGDIVPITAITAGVRPRPDTAGTFRGRLGGPAPRELGPHSDRHGPPGGPAPGG